MLEPQRKNGSTPGRSLHEGAREVSREVAERQLTSFRFIPDVHVKVPSETLSRDELNIFLGDVVRPDTLVISVSVFFVVLHGLLSKSLRDVSIRPLTTFIPLVPQDKVVRVT